MDGRVILGARPSHGVLESLLPEFGAYSRPEWR